MAETPLPSVKEVVARARGTALAGHEVIVNDGKPFLAPADEIEVAQVPRWEDFGSGKGTHGYSFTFRSGGVERSTSVSLRRWGILTCAWVAADGHNYESGEEVRQGLPVTMRATTWGFPDTHTTLGIFKDRTATFSIKEDDTGRDVLLGPGPDSVQKFDVDIVNNGAEKAWTTRFEEETGLPPVIDGLPVAPPTHAELYFEVKIEEESCRSPIIRVPNTKPKSPAP